MDTYESNRADPALNEDIDRAHRTMSQRRKHKNKFYNQRSSQGTTQTLQSNYRDETSTGCYQDISNSYNGRMLGLTGTQYGVRDSSTLVVPAGRVPGMMVKVSSGNPGAHSVTKTTLYHDPSLIPLAPPTGSSHQTDEYRSDDNMYQYPYTCEDKYEQRNYCYDQLQRHTNPRKYLDRKKRSNDLSTGSSLYPKQDHHYSGSEYSSTEHIYNNHQTHSRNSRLGTLSSSQTDNQSSLKLGSTTSYHLSSEVMNPSKYYVQSNYSSESTSFTLPIVSSITRCQQKSNKNSTSSQNSYRSLRLSKCHDKDFDVSGIGLIDADHRLVSSVSPVKSKRQGMLSNWKDKFLWGERGKRKICVSIAALLIIILVIFSALAATLYLTIGDAGALLQETPRIISESGTAGRCSVLGEFRITNQNFWHGLEDPFSEEYKAMSQSIERELDTLFFRSIWSNEYNHSQIISLAEGSLVVKAQILLNTADSTSAKKVKNAFLRGLQSRHGNKWLGQFAIDKTSIIFSEMPSPSPSSTAIQSPTSEEIYKNSINAIESSTLNAEWSDWSSWSSCSPCSYQYEQIRTRECRFNFGKGALAPNIKLCYSTDIENPLKLPSSDIEMKPCQCFSQEYNTDVHETVPSTSTDISASWQVELTPKENEKANEIVSGHDCESCLPEEVCVSLLGESYPSCRYPSDPVDRTGCGGFCMVDFEICQSQGSRGFQCISISNCLNDEWQCDDGLCVPLIKRCDGQMNCYDHSDEQKCQCPAEFFQCGNHTSCLPTTVRCDGKLDCWDGFDELHCKTVPSASPSSISATTWQMVGMGLMKPHDANDDIKPSITDTDLRYTSQLPIPPMRGTRFGTSARNKTTGSLSKLSNRERELLS